MAKQSEFSETFKARQQSNSLEKTFKKCKQDESVTNKKVIWKFNLKGLCLKTIIIFINIIIILMFLNFSYEPGNTLSATCLLYYLTFMI